MLGGSEGVDGCNNMDFSAVGMQRDAKLYVFKISFVLVPLI